MAETYNDINLKSLVFNKVSNEEYRQMVKEGTIKDDEFYITPSELIDVPNIDSTTSGKYLTNDGTGALWSDVKETNIVQDLTNPSADTVPSSQAIADESSRITSVMNNFVSKSGDTMTGRLLLSNTDMGNESTSDTTYFIRKPNEDNTETPTETHIDAFRVYDKNNKIMSDFRSQRTSTSISTQMIARKNKSDGSNVQSSISCGIDSNESPITNIQQNTNVIGTVTATKDSYNFIAQSPSIEKGTTPTDASKYVGYDFRDKNLNRLAWLGVSYATSGTKNLQLQKLDSNLSNFTIGYDTYINGNILTSGQALFKKNPYVNVGNDNRIISQSSNLTKGTAPSASQFGGVSLYDKNNAEMATIYSVVDTNNKCKSAIWVKDPRTSQTATTEISIAINNDGKIISYAPQCSSANSILTTVSHGSGYAKLGNGIIIQSGNFTASASTTTGKVTLPLAMSTSNYRVLFTQNTAGNASYKGTAEIRSTTHGTTYFNWAAVNCSSDFNMFIDWFLIVLPS